MFVWNKQINSGNTYWIRNYSRSGTRAGPIKVSTRETTTEKLGGTLMISER